MAIYNREDPRTALPQLEKRIKGLEDQIFIAHANETKYQEVYDALKAGKIVYAFSPNSYGTYNLYIYSYSGVGKICFYRMQGENTATYKALVLDTDNVWTSYTVNL